MLYECMRDMRIKERQDRRKGKWEIKREEFYERGDLSFEGI